MFDFTPFGGDEEAFDEYDEFVPANLPEPGPELADHRVLTGEEHVAVHETARECFEERGVYDVTFGYNLARLNLDPRHPDAGFRYAEDTDDPSVLWAAFTPTTPFCPQSDTLATGACRALNDLSDRHDYDLVRVRVARIHHRSEAINDTLHALETDREEGVVAPAAETGDGAGRTGHADRVRERLAGPDGRDDPSPGR